MPSQRTPSLLSRAVKRLIIANFRWRGWSAFGAPPPGRRCVIIAVPHTTNWDFPNVLGVTHELGIDVHYMAKDSLFRWPIGNFMRDMGGVEVHRTSRRNVVQQMVDEFAGRDEFMLVIAPEGTRSAVNRWRTGFYQIALQAQVPLVCGMMDYSTKTGGLGPAIMPTGDYRADMRKIVEFYRQGRPKHPERAIDVQTVLDAYDDPPAR